MNIYLLNIFMILIYMLFCKNSIKLEENDRKNFQIYNKRHLIGLLIITVILCIELGLRGDFTTDIINYYYIFHSVKSMSFMDVLKRSEPLYAVINYIIGNLTNSYVILLILIACIFVISYMFFIYKESNIMWLSLLALICSGTFYTSFNLMRMLLAASLYALTYRYIYEKNWKKYVLSVLVISLIHTSVIVMLPLYFLPNIKWEKLKTSVVIVASILLAGGIFAFSDEIIHFVSSYIYTEYLDEGAYGMTFGVGILGTLKALIFSGGILINKRYFDGNNKRDMLIYNGCLLHFIFALCGMRVFMIQRFVHYLMPSIMLGYPIIVSRIKGKRKKQIYVFGIVCILLLSIMNTVIGNNYYFYWNNQFVFW